MIHKNKILREERDNVNREENPKTLKDKGMQDSFFKYEPHYSPKKCKLKQ